MIEARDPSTGTEALRDALHAVARGDRAAFETVYSRTSAKLFGVCVRILPKRSDAEEVLQEIYTTVWRKAASYDASLASPVTWLVMIARSKAIDRARTDDSERTAPIDAAVEVADDAIAGVAAAVQDDERRRLDACLGELEPERRRLVRAAFFDGATYEELARRSETPLGTIKSWIRRSLLKLKACLER